MDRKAQTNQVFVYILSIILILFVGFLVIKFISSFSSDTQDVKNLKTLKQLKKDFQSVYIKYDSEKVLNYGVSSEVRNICFISKSSCINSLTNLSSSQREDLKTIFDSGENMIFLGDSKIIIKENIGDFIATNNGCLCLEIKNNIFTIMMRNNKNKVYLSKLED